MATTPSPLDDTAAPLPTPTGFTRYSWENFIPLQPPAWGEHPFRNRATMESALEQGAPVDRAIVTAADLGSDTAKGTASKLTGLIYLEQGHDYTFHHQGSGTLSIVVGGAAFNASGGTVLVEEWGERDGDDEPGTGTPFTPAASGLYELNLYHYAFVETGDLEVALQVDDGAPQPLDAAHFTLYDSPQTLIDAGIELEQAPGGYYTVGPAPEAAGLVEASWFDLDLSGSGRGEAPDRLQSIIDAADTPDALAAADDAQLEGVAPGTATLLSGLIGLEGGATYTFSGRADDSFRLIVDDEVVADARWCRAQGAFSGSFTPREDGAYSLALYHHNADGPGELAIDVQVDDGTTQPLDSAHFELYRDASDAPAAPADTVGIAAPADEALPIA